MLCIIKEMSTAAPQTESWFQAARRRWPSVMWSMVRFQQHVGEEQPNFPEDLFLAGAASERIDTAWSIIHVDLQPDVNRRLARVALGNLSREDLWQETITKLMLDADKAPPLPDGRMPTRIRGYRGLAAIATYLTVTARRIAVDNFRKQRLPMEGCMTHILDAADNRVQNSHTTESQEVARRFSQEFASAFMSLPNRQQALLALVYGRAMPKGEAGKAVGLPAYGVTRELAAAIHSLKDRLEMPENSIWSVEAISIWLRGWTQSHSDEMK